MYFLNSSPSRFLLNIDFKLLPMVKAFHFNYAIIPPRYSTRILSTNEFRTRYLTTIRTSKLYDELSSILTSNLTSVNKQRRIEKLMNVYYLNKDSSKFEFNPLWWNHINQIFAKDFLLFEPLYNNYLNYDIKTNLFSPIQPLTLFSSRDFFSLLIYNYLNLLENNNLQIPKTSTFVSTLVDDLYIFYKHQLETFYFSNYISTTYPELRDMILLNLGSTKSSFLNWDKQLYDYLSLKYSTDVSTSKYNTLSNKFLTNYYPKYTLEIKRFLYKIVYGSYHILLDTNVFERHIVYSGKRRYDYSKVFSVDKFNSLSTMSYMNCNLPMITPPLDWDSLGNSGGYILNKRNKYMTLCRSLSKGVSSISYSAFTVNSINILQKKCYKINKLVYNFFKSDLFLKLSEILTFSELYSKYHTYIENLDNYKSYKETHTLDENVMFFYKCDVSKLYKSRTYRQASSSTRTQLYKDLLSKHNLTDELFSLYSLVNSSHLDFLSSLSKYNSHNFFLSICDIYKEEELYNVSNLDFRTRINPLGRTLNRATGIYKNVLSDVNSKFTYTPSLILKLKEYIYLNYIGNLNKYTMVYLHTACDNLLSPLVSNLDCTSKDLQLLFSTPNNLSLNYSTPLFDLVLKSKNSLLFLLGVNDYINYLLNPTYESTLEIAFDQCSSGPMIYSLLSQDPFMGNLTNCFPKDPNVINDLYSSFLKALLEKLSTCNITTQLIILSKKHTLCDWLKSNMYELFDRSFSKSILMPKFYNMGKKGLDKTLYALLSTYDFNDDSLKHLVNYLSGLILRLLSKLYPYTMSYQKELMVICKHLYDNKEWVTFRTLDGSLLRYKYLSNVDRYGRIYINDRTLTYRIYTHVSTDKAISWRQITSYPPNYLHSLDGAFCRIIYSVFYKFTGFIAEPVHDCFRVPLSHISLLSQTIKYVYLYYFFNKQFHRDKIGLNKNSCSTVELNSSNYSLYKSYFPRSSLSISNHVISDTILKHLHTNDTLTNTILKSINKSILLPEITEHYYQSFLNSKHIFNF